MPLMPEGEKGEGDRVNERHHQKHLQVNQQVGRALPLPHPTPPHPIALLACPGQAFPRPVPCRFPWKTWRKKGSGRDAELEGRSYLEASGEEFEDDLWFWGVGDWREGRSGGVWRDRDLRWEVRTAAGNPGRLLSRAGSLRFRGGGASRPHGRT